MVFEPELSVFELLELRFRLGFTNLNTSGLNRVALTKTYGSELKLALNDRTIFYRRYSTKSQFFFKSKFILK